MATSPPSSSFPPPSHANPKKRPSMSSQASATSAAKRRQLHPLRQTSFPAAPSNLDSAITHSARSETGSIANSTFSTTSSKIPGRRGRPKKQAPLSAQDGGDNAGTTGRSTGKDGGAAKSVVSAKSGGAGAGAGAGGAAPGEGSDIGDEEDDEDEDADELEVTADEKQNQAEEEERRRERELKFAEFLPAELNTRWWRGKGFGLESKHVRRIVNQVMSQSSSEKVVSTVMWSSKLFAVRLIDGARDVQREWAEGFDVARATEKEWRREELRRLERKRDDEGKDMPDTERVLLTRDIERLRKESGMYIPNPHRAGLLPDHIRESLRRYRANGEGYGAGMQGASHNLLGIIGSAAYRVGDGTTGRRLFR